MATKNSFLEGFMTAAEAQSLLSAGATHIGIYVNIETSEDGENMYDILANGVNPQKNGGGPVLTLCPTPCPTQPGTRP